MKYILKEDSYLDLKDENCVHSPLSLYLVGTFKDNKYFIVNQARHNDCVDCYKTMLKHPCESRVNETTVLEVSGQELLRVSKEVQENVLTQYYKKDVKENFFDGLTLCLTSSKGVHFQVKVDKTIILDNEEFLVTHPLENEIEKVIFFKVIGSRLWNVQYLEVKEGCSLFEKLQKLNSKPEITSAE